MLQKGYQRRLLEIEDGMGSTSSCRHVSSVAMLDSDISGQDGYWADLFMACRVGDLAEAMMDDMALTLILTHIPIRPKP